MAFNDSGDSDYEMDNFSETASTVCYIDPQPYDSDLDSTGSSHGSVDEVEYFMERYYTCGLCEIQLEFDLAMKVDEQYLNYGYSVIWHEDIGYLKCKWCGAMHHLSCALQGDLLSVYDYVQLSNGDAEY